MAAPTISAVAFCPHPPLLLPEIAAGAGIEMQSLRFACAAAVDRLVAAAPGDLLVIGADGPAVTARDFAPGNTTATATAAATAGRRPLPLLIADSLLRGRAGDPTYVPISADGRPASAWPITTEPMGLLVMGDGSARRSLKGPGYLDERAEPFDNAVVAALAAASVGELADLDLTLAAELLVGGAATWVAAAQLLRDRRWRGEILYTDAPFGVMYTVAFWTPA